MNPSDPRNRFDELGAGRALANLDADEIRELRDLERSHGFERDEDLDELAAALEIESAMRAPVTMPAGLANRLQGWADTLEAPATETAAEHRSVVRPQVPAWKSVALHPLAGWFAAAAAIVLALLLPRGDKAGDPALTVDGLRGATDDAVQLAFAGLGAYEAAGGEVIWSDSKQAGFMTLRGIPANDPSVAQYQLWIVDPARDADAPVDGGVFNVPADGSAVVVPIDAKLAVRQPQAFVITLEQPGGVVKSKQEVVVALAKL